MIKHERLAWFYVYVWVLLIYLTIPIARRIQETVRANDAAWLFFWFTVAVFTLLAAWLVVQVWRRVWIISSLRMILLGIILGIFLSLTWMLRRNPEEAIHFVQYGILTILIFRAYRFRLSDPSIFFATSMLGIMLGIIDELIQWITPRRYFDYRDIGINTLAVVLMSIAIALVVKLPYSWRVASAGGMRAGFKWLAVNLLLLLFCLMNTASMKEWYSRYIPAANRVPTVTAEYGYLYRDPEIGTFKSRLSPVELARQDMERSSEMSAIIKQIRTEEQYNSFIGSTPPHRQPFLVEARVHLFRRDRHATTARHTGNPEEKVRSAIIALRENQILERYFPNTLRESGHWWRDDIRAYFTPLVPEDAFYASPVSHYLITGFSRRTVLFAIIPLLVLSLAGARCYGGKQRHE
ncbi:MAG TPA: VanZ family protein [Kiritimatiellia bacterium]|nr:VanZ family protein [Kiritimatiellia bacterium]